jgi:GNAT superfamily N-acetyltransferase
MLLCENGYHDVPLGKIAAVTTSLEMFERPPLRPERDGAPGRLRHISQPDVAWYRDLYRRIGANWLWFSRLRLSSEVLAAMIRDPAVEIHALMSGGKDEGLIELDFGEPNTCELRMFGITAKLIGTGAGRWLMNRAIEAAWSRPIGRFWVHTCTFDHPSALSFYLRSGFTAFRRQIEIADDPRLDGTLAPDDAPHVPVVRERELFVRDAQAPRT